MIKGLFLSYKPKINIFVVDDHTDSSGQEQKQQSK